MKSQFLSLLSIIFSCVTISAQDFVGYVKKADTMASPIFQANVEVAEGDKPFKTFKTYFDGSFKFKPNKNQKYLIQISYPGYTDTAFTIMADKNGKTEIQSVTVKLKKDGMRLMGMIKSREEDFPIKDATIVLRNVMTRKEERITTRIDGKYNFKLEYETNYKVWIDKRSTGIFNVYKDTSFYVSTIGFNLPLDYKLDISLDWMENATTRAREGYDASKQPANKNLKPIIGIEQKDSSVSTTNSATAETALEQEKKQEEKKIEVVRPPKKERSKKKRETPDVVTGQDTNQVISQTLNEGDAKSVDLLEMTRQKAIADKVAREVEEEKTKTEMLALQQKEEQAAREKAEQEEVARATKEADEKKKKEEALKVQKQQEELTKAAEIFSKRMKFVQDSVEKVKLQESKRVEEAIRQKAREDSIASTKRRKDTLLVVAQKLKVKEDSVTRAKIEATKEKAKQDSIAKIKLLQSQAKATPKQTADSTSRTIGQPQRKIIVDSASVKKSFYLPKTQEELIVAAEAFARQKKLIQDSIAKAKLVEQKKSVGAQQEKK